jgi:hypothetical protein
MDSKSSKEGNFIIVSKDELAELFLTHRIQETHQGWVLDNKRIDILALHAKEIKYIEHLHKADEYKIVYKN